MFHDEEQPPEEKTPEDETEKSISTESKEPKDEPEEEEEEPEEPEELNIDEFFLEEEKDNVIYQKLNSFHTLYITKDTKQVLLRASVTNFNVPFFNQFTFIGEEGNLPDMIDCTPGNSGFQFKLAPNGQDVLLIQMQHELPSSDVAASLYDASTGGALDGYLRVFEPVCVTRQKEQVEMPVDLKLFEFLGGKKDKAKEKQKQQEKEQAKQLQQTTTTKTMTTPTKRHFTRTGPITEVLIDITNWLDSFSSLATEMANSRGGFGGGPKRGGVRGGQTHLITAKGFPLNMYFKYMTQTGSMGPVKNGQNGNTLYYSIAFCKLPKIKMISRQKDRRVGYFETSVISSGKNMVNGTYNVINKWDIAKRKHILYCIDPDVPLLYHAVIKQGVLSWNDAFQQAGCGTNVVQCLASYDEKFPKDYARGDARYSAVYMTDPAIPVYGFGPSLTDFRTGEIIVGHILLGLSAFTEGASRYNMNLLENSEAMLQTNGTRAPWLPANHPDVLKNILSTVVHEVGHTLGLRHNFIAQEDGNTSVMAYGDDLDTTSYHLEQQQKNKEQPSAVYGGHYLYAPGLYDVYAIKYGYTPLPNEQMHVRHPDLNVLANNQSIGSVLSSTPFNPMFATDDDIGDEDPRVNTWNRNVRGCGYDKMAHSMELRRQLLTMVRNKTIYPELYSERVRASIFTVARHVENSIQLIGGREQDRTRRQMKNVASSDALRAVTAVVDFCVGDLYRFNEEETEYMMSKWPSSSYNISTIDFKHSHERLSKRYIQLVLASKKLLNLEMQYNSAHTTTGGSAGASGAVVGGGKRLRTYDVLHALAFGSTSNYTQNGGALFSPFTNVSSSDDDGSTIDAGGTDLFIQQVNTAGNDLLRTCCSLNLARIINKRMHTPTIHAAVRAGCAAFVSDVSIVLRTWLEMYSTSINSIARAHWNGILIALNKQPVSKSNGGIGNIMQLFGGGRSTNDFESGDNGNSDEKQDMSSLEEDDALHELMHMGCNRMRCRHDPYKTEKLRKQRNKETLRQQLLIELKQTVLMGSM